MDPYYTRFGAPDPQIALAPRPDTGLIVVIPCFNEPHLIRSLDALWNCSRPDCAVEVIVVINSSSAASPEILKQNVQTLLQAREWAASHQDPRFNFYFLHFPALTPKHAGVGLARKIGMDEAARRFDAISHPGGVIVCFDADSLCDPNYLRAVEQHFEQHPDTPGCSIYFEHPLEGELPTPVYQAITLYELHLRYYIQALRFARFPYAFHTIGSSMTVRADVYKKQGGMNKRRAGEDFYFLHKIIPLGRFTDLTTTRVVPSPRSSDRVPFGTGKAVGDFLRGDDLKTYPLEAFIDLRHLFTEVLTRGPKAFLADVTSKWPPSIASYLEQQQWPKALQEIQANTASDLGFQKRFFHWFNGFQVMKFIHFARDVFYAPPPIVTEASRFLELIHRSEQAIPDAKSLLNEFRKRDAHVPQSRDHV